MIKADWKKIQQNLLKDFSKRERDIIERRFGLVRKNIETLESIGKSYGVCRERIRQIEAKTFSEIRKKVEEKQYQKIINSVIRFLKGKGGVSEKDILLKSLAPNFGNHLSFLIALSDKIHFVKENDKFHSFYYLENKDKDELEKTIEKIVSFLERKKKTLNERELFNVIKKQKPNLTKEVFLSYISISKIISRGPHGLFGLRGWPEITPKGVKDKAYLVLKVKNKPLHFEEIATFISELGRENKERVVSATVHNELIRDQRFVLVGRGIYGLKEWGYEPGFVKDIIAKVIKKAGRPLPKEEIVKKVLAQRIVKENTILLNLQNRNYFIRDKEGKYTIREV